ncbi:glycerol-3-phosphate dehydrogenase [Sphingomonas corticis]|jgi:glycerol-3-phosphate dehydrogenase|uniref:Glycerol-3-phosphate dehydrogenase n=1 Tax=Sphingomonas corticis TaxID=2722791 RepID=A0ABX1CN10_9SPHN|nr:glycerol-3-phosphate dehydrogenase [Sphingomonas corticis]NJR78206.1 glycerol-3-phosphate dehydrogenase [Sphingomonas corticis]
MRDLLIVGGGINGAGIARDAAGRGLTVTLVEQDDLASHTSSASTKLIHGGLRYLEYGEFRLVRESLRERERLLGIAPHIIWPLRFVLPQTRSPRPAWLVRTGLFLYDHIGGRRSLPGTQTVPLDGACGEGLSDRRGKAFVYSDCWVDDSRLVVLNARDAADRGAEVLTRTRFLSARRDADGWRAVIDDGGAAREIRARILVNAAGPWVADVLGRVPSNRQRPGVRLVKGSHIVVPRLYAGEHAFMLQNPDRRIVFAIPYERDFTLVGTTDEPWTQSPGPATIAPDETRYLLETVARYFARPVAEGDVKWSYAGIRPLHDDHAASASAVTRDYVLDLDGEGAPLLSIFGGKITTYRKLAEHAMATLGPWLPASADWTAGQALPGGALPDGDAEALVLGLQASHPGAATARLRRLVRAYGTDAAAILAAGGEDLGGGLTTGEVDHLVAREWARTSEDVLFRRSKLGLHVPPGTRERLDAHLSRAAARVPC